jgi:hypothetical protein
MGDRRPKLSKIAGVNLQHGRYITNGNIVLLPTKLRGKQAGFARKPPPHEISTFQNGTSDRCDVEAATFVKQSIPPSTTSSKT